MPFFKQYYIFCEAMLWTCAFGEDITQEMTYFWTSAIALKIYTDTIEVIGITMPLKNLLFGPTNITAAALKR